ncbi:unnamed protein product [Microthlaspi erraticum]|uniref:SLH domain-containing protein n=1 Tax=Microthlaspi erraticum TaxID=1685480 RepID=A0A6D2KDJ6_9BRAS|nr:unnamed protein product [Microthlaspi erraticum]
MCTFSIRKSPTSSFIFPKSAPLLVRHRLTLPLLAPSLKPPRFRVVASLSGTSWVSQASKDKYGGWALNEDDPPLPHWKSKKKWRNVVITGVGSSLAVLFATVAYFSISKKGFRFSNPLHYISVDSDQNENEESETTTSLFTDEKISASEADSESVDYVSDTVDTTTSTVKAHRVTTPVSLDAAQLEAVAVLKKLKIIEDDVVADELCTRREYARWLVRSNLLLERNPKHKIVPAVALAGSSIPAFDDVNTKDPDFEYIQALAEAGITSSKLSGEDSRNSENANFYPESFVSRLDLVNWKAQLECDFHPETMEEVSRTKVDYIDTKNINPDMALGFFLDFLTGDKSTIRNVFGRIKRFQPNRPVTKAQAAVALTSGKMAKAISAELSRLEAESFLQKAEMEEIRSELLEKGEIRQFWDELLQVERSRGVEMEELRLSSVSELEEEKTAQEKWFAERLKEKAAIDCQKQLVNRLREEIEEMSEKLTTDKSVYLVEQSELQEMLSEVQAKLESLLDKRTVLEAEVEALRILRSWVEDEAKASQARAKVLQEAGRRWKWNEHA